MMKIELITPSIATLLYLGAWLEGVPSITSLIGGFIGGFISGVISFYLAHLVGDPIVQWNQLRSDITSAIIYYINILLSDEQTSSRQNGQEELRRLAAKIRGLSQIIRMRWITEKVFQIPSVLQAEEASSKLIGLSNIIADIRSNDKSSAYKRIGVFSFIQSIEKIMRIKIDPNVQEKLKREHELIKLYNQL